MRTLNIMSNEIMCCDDRGMCGIMLYQVRLNPFSL